MATWHQAGCCCAKPDLCTECDGENAFSEAITTFLTGGCPPPGSPQFCNDTDLMDTVEFYDYETYCEWLAYREGNTLSIIQWKATGRTYAKIFRFIDTDWFGDPGTSGPGPGMENYKDVTGLLTCEEGAMSGTFDLQGNPARDCDCIIQVTVS